MSKQHIIIVDDEANIRFSLESCLNNADYRVTCCSNVEQTLDKFKTDDFDLAILDLCIGNDKGIELFTKIRKISDLPVIFISGNATLSEAAESIKQGAFDFLEKPFSNEKFLVTVKNCLSFYAMKAKLKKFEESDTSEILGEHKSVLKLNADIKKISKTSSTVFVSGESGTGKELIAKSIHNNSVRKHEAFIKVNCSAIPENLVESALFGHEKGAFTGANSHKKGFFELAHKGTLFLDEIGDMPLSAQASLLRALESSEIQKVGAEKTISVDVRVVAASHKNLKEEVKVGCFREDLLYRISVIPLFSPPLRERDDDIALLADYLLKTICEKNDFAPKQFHPDCYLTFKRYTWPGNVRELRNIIERMAILGGRELLTRDIPSELTSVPRQEINHASLSLKEYRDKIEREYILSCLKEVGGNISQASKKLKIDRAGLYKKMSQLDIQREQYFI